MLGGIECDPSPHCQAGGVASGSQADSATQASSPSCPQRQAMPPTPAAPYNTCPQRSTTTHSLAAGGTVPWMRQLLGLRTPSSLSM